VAHSAIQRYFGGLSRNTFLLAFASLFADISTEMLYPRWPDILWQRLPSRLWGFQRGWQGVFGAQLLNRIAPVDSGRPAQCGGGQVNWDDEIKAAHVRHGAQRPFMVDDVYAAVASQQVEKGDNTK
jgi:hypothetical protein